MKTLKPLVFASLGIAMEVAFTAIIDYPKKKDLKLRGESYVWMFPIYASVPIFLDYLYPRMRRLSPLTRLSVYVPLLFACEYVSGHALRRFAGECPWEKNYRGSKFSVHDLIRLDYAPAWAVACALFERTYLALEGASTHNTREST